MKVLFHLGHPAHFHLFKKVILKLKNDGVQVQIAIKKKDVLENLLNAEGFEYINILPKGRKGNFLSIGYGQLTQDLRLLKVCKKSKPDLLIGTSVAISHVGKILGIPSLNCNEDDAEAVPLYAKLAYPWATKILAPDVCSVGKWEYKKISYKSYHELAYLHPKHFTPSQLIASKYVSLDQKYFIIRFAKLEAHHDNVADGLNLKIACQIIETLKPYGKIIITSEKAIDKELEEYRMNIHPEDMHHVMAFASIFVGDSQTMAAESGVLGVPFIRINGFVGRLSYLEELENKYKLGFGIKPNNTDQLFAVLREILEMKGRENIFKKRRDTMLLDKIELSDFLYNYITGFLQNSLKINVSVSNEKSGFDFTQRKYQQLLETLIKSGYTFQTFNDFLISPKERSIILRHDVDSLPKNSLVFAKLQAKLGIRSVYYFRAVKESWDENVIKEISQLGHEIGYHYENLTTKKGDLNKAISDFEFHLEKLRKIAPVNTICMHGSPMSKYDSKDLWKTHSYKNYGIIGEPYFDVDFNTVFYLTDTGRRWDGDKVSVRDKVYTNTFNLSFNTTNEIIFASKNNKLPNKIMFTFHPQRWNNNVFLWAKEFIGQNVKNGIKKYFYVK